MVNNKIKQENLNEGERSWLVNEIGQYIYRGFALIRQCRQIEDVVRMVDRNFHHTVYVRQGGILAGVAIYFMLTDLTLEKIVTGEIDLKNSGVFSLVEKEEGDNMHVFTIRADKMSVILKGIRDVLKTLKPKTISWYRDNEMNNFRIIKRKI